MKKERKDSTADKSAAVYRVADGVISINHENQHYLVADGLVSLPASENWYLDMIGFALIEQVS